MQTPIDHFTRVILVFLLVSLTVTGLTGTGFSQQSSGALRNLKQDLEAARQAKLAQQARAARLEVELSQLGGRGASWADRAPSVTHST